MVKRDYSSKPFGTPLDKKSEIDEFIGSVSGVDLRTPSNSSLHQRDVWFNKTFNCVRQTQKRKNTLVAMKFGIHRSQRVKRKSW